VAVTEARSRFASRIGFLLAGIGAAVGLGSFWRFPQLTSQNGGGAFVFVFLLMLVFFGVPLLWAELALGQRAQRSPLQAFEAIAGRHWRVVGFLFVAVSFTLLGYYTILAGYVLRYALTSLTGTLRDPGVFLGGAQEGIDAVFFGALVAVLTAGIIAAGVAGGLERANRIMMPALFLLLVGLVVYAQLQPGAAAGRSFYLSVDWSQINLATLQAALGQVFFAVGIGFGIMLTYASYTAAGRSLLPTSATISGSILVVGFLAGLMIFPLVFSHGLAERIADPDAGSVSTLMLTMPATFDRIGGVFGAVLMFLFFVMLLFAALSTTIALLEVLVSVLRDHFGWSRFSANVVATEWYLVPGLLAAASQDVFAWLDTLLGNVLLYLAAIGLCLAFTFAIRDPVGVLLSGVERPTRGQYWTAYGAAIIVRFIAPLFLAALFLAALPATLRGLHIL
jgi:neurotransmitter:Na+ symporter, NSS family